MTETQKSVHNSNTEPCLLTGTVTSTYTGNSTKKSKRFKKKKKKAIWAISSKSLQSIHALWPRNSMLGISHKKIKTAVERFKYKHVHSGTVYYSETEIRVL